MSWASTVGRHLAIRGKRAAAKSELLDDTTADAFALSDKRFEPVERREKVAAASTRAQDGVGFAGRVTTLVAAIGKSVNRVVGADLAVVGFFGLGTTLGGVLAARALFAAVEVGFGAANILRSSVARTACGRSHGGFFAAGTSLSSLAGGFLIGTAASGSSAVAWSLLVIRSGLTAMLDGIAGRRTCYWLRMAFKQTQAPSDAAQTFVYIFMLDRHTLDQCVLAIVPSHPRLLGFFFGNDIVMRWFEFQNLAVDCSLMDGIRRTATALRLVITVNAGRRNETLSLPHLLRHHTCCCYLC